MQDKLNLKLKLSKTNLFQNDTYFKLTNCTSRKKVSINPDGNCLYRALSWWLTEGEDFHGLIRSSLVQFMKTSSTCQQYVRNKSYQNMEEYLLKNNTINSTIWGSDVEIFCAAIWLETDIFILKDNDWHKFSFLGFISRKGRNQSIRLAIYLENSFFHFEPIISVSRKANSN